MAVSNLVEYLFIGGLYLIPYFVVHYTVVCASLGGRIGFRESISTAYSRLPALLKGTLSLELKEVQLTTLGLLGLLSVVGMMSNGILHRYDDELRDGLMYVASWPYQKRANAESYLTDIKILKECEPEQIVSLQNRIRYQIVLTRHGIATSVIHMLCLLFILWSRWLSCGAKLIWTALVLISSSSAAFGFLATLGWHDGVREATLQVFGIE